jgi:2-amino-4-hydroxy-6-hydroxymethyldihydropteridine diphosphokinase
MTDAVLGLGANLGDPEAALRGAVAAIDALPDTAVIAASHVYRTSPVGGPEQPDYCNAVVRIHTELAPAELLSAVLNIEQVWQRTREVRWGPRTLDIDVLTYGTVRQDDPVLTLPHPRAHERGFVLVPWLEIDPDAELPGHGRIDALVGGLDVSDVVRTQTPLVPVEEL